MVGEPQTIRKIDQWNIERGKNCENGGEGCFLFGIFDQSAQQQVGDEQEPQNECRSELCVPGPPDAPDRTRPKRAGDQANRAADDADFDAGDTESIPFALSGDETGEPGEEG